MCCTASARPTPRRALGCPNVVFRDELIAPVTSRIHRLYVAPLLADWQLPYIVFRPGVGWQAEFLHRLDGLFNTLQAEAPGHELRVQNQLTGLWELLWAHRAELPATGTQKAERLVQVRTQKMLRCIHTQFAAPLTLDDIAAAAGISRSEASRCFQACLRTSPVGYLTWYRIEMARRALAAGQDTIEEISRACGFQSASYFCAYSAAKPGKRRCNTAAAADSAPGADVLDRPGFDGQVLEDAQAAFALRGTGRQGRP